MDLIENHRENATAKSVADSVWQMFFGWWQLTGTEHFAAPDNGVVFSDKPVKNRRGFKAGV